MEPYSGVDDDSGVIWYEIAPDGITVQFKTGGTYLYTYGSAGKLNVERMKQLAISGDGLNSFMNKYTKRLYAAKL